MFMFLFIFFLNINISHADNIQYNTWGRDTFDNGKKIPGEYDNFMLPNQVMATDKYVETQPTDTGSTVASFFVTGTDGKTYFMGTSVYKPGESVSSANNLVASSITLGGTHRSYIINGQTSDTPPLKMLNGVYSQEYQDALAKALSNKKAGAADKATEANTAAAQAAQTAASQGKSQQEQAAAAAQARSDVLGQGQAAPPKPVELDCGLTGLGKDSLTCVAAKLIYYAVLTPASWLVRVAGGLFDLVFKITVINLSTTLGKSADGTGDSGFYVAIKDVWGTFRDLINMSFIFILLYAAINTILKADTEGMKKTVSSVIIAALLINFSLFFTQVIIDVSNNFAVAIYNQIGRNGDSISVGIMKSLHMNELLTDATSLTVGKDKFLNIILISLGGSVFLFVLAIVFLIVSVLFIVRFVTFIILMMMSPVGIGGQAIPKLKEAVGGDFWNDLLSQCFFAPVFMLFLWVTMKLLTVVTTLGGKESILGGNTQYGVASSLVGQGGGLGFSYFMLSFTVLIFLLIKGLEISKSMSAKGAAGIQKMALKYSGDAARSVGGRLANATGGWAANKFTDSAIGKRIGSTRIGSGLYNLTDKAGASRRTAIEEAKKQELKRAELRTAAANQANKKDLDKQQQIHADAGVLRADERLVERENQQRTLETHEAAMKSATLTDVNGNPLTYIDPSGTVKFGAENIERALEVKTQISEEIQNIDKDIANNSATIRRIQAEIQAGGGTATAAQNTALGVASRDLATNQSKRTTQQASLAQINNVIKPVEKATKDLEKIDEDLKKLYSGYDPKAYHESAATIREIAKDVRKNGDATIKGLTGAALTTQQKALTQTIKTLQTEIKNTEIKHARQNANDHITGGIGWGLNQRAREAVRDEYRRRYTNQV